MKILVTGAKGFVGKNLVAELRNRQCGEVLEYDLDTDPALLHKYTAECDFVYHLAGVNRPEHEEDFMEGNFGFTSDLLAALKRHCNTAPVMLSSSVQAERDNPYGRSKKAGEELLLRYGQETGAKILIYRFTNLFGKWSRPHYNGVIATFCYQIARGLPIQVSDPSIELNFAYIDDVVEELLRALDGKETWDGAYCTVPVSHPATLGWLAETIGSFSECRSKLQIPDLSDPLTKKLYSTYLSYLPEEAFSYPLEQHADDRGSFTEIIRTADRGQFSVNIAKPGITKGNHWHHTKNEKFLVVSGEAVIRFRQVGSEHVIEFRVSGDKPEVVDIPTGYTHSITNVGNCDLVTFMWANEPFDPEKPDTYFMEV